jgi:hypothetical protein
MDDEEREKRWTEGHRAAWASMLQKCLSELGQYAPKDARAVLELEQARRVARELCEELGLEDPEDLHLADVIEKRIGRHIIK